ncbi:hypothetical protein GXP67_26990 [Rhodocytophaga rosea]|uniref:Peptide zinc metalloprotease protein n=1 Tax=Rhodocytophaga rosea TaxID=2704465 RepID=A0A6C0GR44_9BACT|nr:hypothetical protein [Rhodocytophaga rosea]QHT70032.1 hypothetical protein GXP67_26990 [Rhodocytophaga rosea]
MYPLPGKHILDAVKLIHNGEQYLLVCEGAIFSTSKLVYEILSHLKEAHSIEVVSAYLKQNYQLNAEEASQLFQASIIPLLQKLETIAGNQKPAASYIYFRRTLLQASTVQAVSGFLKVLFNTPWFILLGSLSILLNMIYAFHFSLTLAAVDSFSLQESCFLCVILLLILLFHEMGHAAAASKLGAAPKEIGFGFYFLFPVLFADVSDIWSYPKYKRILVNTGGIYFQLLANIPLILAFLYLEDDASRRMLSYIITTNLLVMFYSLLPFLRNDGYWIYSDFFNLPNLMNRAKEYPRNLYKSVREHSAKSKYQASSITKDLPLFVFTIGNYAFILFVLYAFWMLLFTTISDLQAFLLKASSSTMAFHEYARMGFRVAITLGILIIVIRQKIGQLKKLYHSYLIASK